MRPSEDISRAMNEHGDAVWRACVAYVPAHDAEDVLQNTFLKFAMNDQAFSNAGTRPTPKLHVAINECKDILKAFLPAKNISLEKAASKHTTTICSASKTIRPKPKSALSAYLKPWTHSAIRRTQVYLSLVEGYTAPEISEMTNMPENTVYSWISRGRKRLREVLR